MVRLIQKWLEGGRHGRRGSGARPRKGPRKGAVISPLLANLYLHYVFDLWVKHGGRRDGAGRRDQSCATPMMVRHERKGPRRAQCV